MLRDVSDDMALHLKDRLRDVRDFLRMYRHDHQRETRSRQAVSDIEKLLGRAVSVVDDTLTLAESTSRTMLLGSEGNELVLRPLTDYFVPDPMEGERAFRRQMYQFAKAFAGKLDNTEIPVIRETLFTGAHESVRQRQGHALLALRNTKAPETVLTPLANVMAHLLQEICSRSMNEAVAHATPASEESCIRVFTPGVLASGLAILDDGLTVHNLLDIATLAVSARRERMARSLRADQPIADLTRIFENLLRHLP